MSVQNTPEEDMISLINSLDLDKEVLEQSLVPERCRHCGCLLTPSVDRGRLIYGCFECDADRD
jgi:hypothetical protein